MLRRTATRSIAGPAARPSVAVLLAFAACGEANMLPEAPRQADGSPSCAAGAVDQQEYVLRVKHEGRQRTALVWVPPGPGPHDVVVNLHEYRAEPRRQAYYSQWHPMVDSQNVILVAPDGKAAGWNVGKGCCGRAADKYNVNDSGFLDALMAELDRRVCTTGNVLATGIGNGGMMAHRWACESDVPDAIVSVGGALQTDSCDRSTPVPVLHYHGSMDGLFPADGRKGHTPVQQAQDTWAAKNGITGFADEMRDGDLGCAVGQGGTPTTFCTVYGMEDLWPGAKNSGVTSDSPLAHATTGAWAWVKTAWDPRPPQPAAIAPTPPVAPVQEATPSPAPQ